MAGMANGATDLTEVVDRRISNILLHQTLNKMEYFRTRCVEMEEKHGLDFHQLKEQIAAGDSGVNADWEELQLWEDYFYAFEEWKHKYEELNRFIS